MGWTNPEQPYDPNELDFDYDLFEFNTSVITDANPWMAQYPEVVTELARSGLSPLELQAEANNMFYHTQANLMFETLPYLSPEQQRVTFNSLNEEAKEMLRSAGYIPPEGYQPDWVEKTFGTALNYLTFPLRATLGTLARTPYIGGSAQWTLENVVLKISDMPARLYRTAKQMEPWEQAAMLAAAVGSVATKRNMFPITTRVGRGLQNVSAAGRTLGRAGVVATDVPFLLGGAYIGGSATDLIPNGTNFADAFKRAGKGETLFREQAFNQLNEITQDLKLQNLAQQVAFFVDEGALQSEGRTLVEKLAIEVASQPDANKDEVYANAAGRFVQERLVDVNDPRFQLFQQALATLLADERFREMVNILQRNKISIGRDIARAVGLEPGTAGFTFVSGGADALFTWYLDPFLAATPYARSLKFNTLGVATDVGARSRAGYGWLWNKRPKELWNTQFEKRAWMSNNNIRGLGKVDEDIARALTTNNIAYMPEAYRSAFFAMKQHFVAKGLMDSTGKAKGTITREDVLRYFRTQDGMMRIHAGLGQVHGLPHQQIWDARRAPVKRTAMRNTLRTFRGRLSSAQDVQRLRAQLAEHGVASDWLLDSAGDVYSPQVIDDHVKTVKGDPKYAVGLQARLGNFVDSVSTMGQTHTYVDLADPTSLAKLVNAMGVIGRLSYRERERAISEILAHNTVGARRAAVRSFYNTVFEISGIKYRPKGQEFIDQFIAKAFQGFGYHGNENLINPALSEVATTAGLDISHQSTKLAVPNMKELSRVVRDDAYMNTLMGITRDGQVLDAGMSNVWKPAVLIRLAFIPRAFGEEGLAWLMRGTEFSIMQNIAARQVAKYDLYTSVRSKLESGVSLHKLTPAERGAVSKKLVRHMYPELERLVTQNGANVSASRQLVGKMFGPGEHMLLKQYEGFIRWLGRYQGIPQLKKTLQRLEQTHPDLTTLIAGRKGSWTWAGATGLDNNILVSAQNYVNRHARIMAESLSARTHNQWNTDLGQMDEFFIFDDVKGRGKTPLAVAAIGGVRQKVAQADFLYKRGYWEDLSSKFDDPAKGQLYAQELLRRAPVEDATYNATHIGEFADVIRILKSMELQLNDFQAGAAAELLLHLSMFENDLWRVLADEHRVVGGQFTQNLAQAMDDSMQSGVFDMTTFAKSLRKYDLFTNEIRVAFIEQWRRLEKFSPDMRGYAKALAANLIYAPENLRITVTGGMWDAGAATTEGRRLYMGKTPVKSLWLTEVDEAGNLVIRPARQPQWQNKNAISMSTDPQQALRYSLNSFEDGSNPYRGVVFEMDADFVASEFGTTMDDLLANPVTYNDLMAEGYVAGRQARLLNTDHRAHSWSTEVALQPSPEFMSVVDNPTYRELLPIYNEARDIIDRLPELVSEDLRAWAWDVRDATRQLDMSRYGAERVSELLANADNAETVLIALQNFIERLTQVDPSTLRNLRTQFLEPSRQRLINDPALTDLIKRADARPADIVDDVLINFANFVFDDLTRSVNELLSFGALGQWDQVRTSSLANVVSAFSGERFDNLLTGMSPEVMFETFIKQRAASRSALDMYRTFNEFIRNEYVAKPFIIPAGKWRALSETESVGMLDEMKINRLDPEYGVQWSEITDALLKRFVFEDRSLATAANQLIDLRRTNRLVEPEFVTSVNSIEQRLNEALHRLQASEEVLAEFGRLFDGGLNIDSLRHEVVFGANETLARRETLTTQERIEYEIGLPDGKLDVSQLQALERERVRNEIRIILLEEYRKLINDPATNWVRATELAEHVIRQRMPYRYDVVLDQELQQAYSLFEVLFNDDVVGLPVNDIYLVASGTTARVDDIINNDVTLQRITNELFIEGVDRGIGPVADLSLAESLLLDSYASPQLAQKLFDNPAWQTSQFQDAYLAELRDAGSLAGQGTLPVANKSLVGNNEMLQRHLKDQYNLRLYQPEFANDLASTEFTVAQNNMNVAQPPMDNMVRYYFPELKNTDKLVREIENMQLPLQLDPRVVIGEDGLIHVSEAALEELVARLVRSQTNKAGRFGAILKLPVVQQERLLRPFVEAALYYPTGSVDQVLRKIGSTDPVVIDWVTHTLSDIAPDVATVRRGMHQVDMPLAVAKSRGVGEWGVPYDDVTSKYKLWEFSDDAGSQIEYVNGNILSDGTVGMSPRQAVRAWSDASIDSDFHLLGKGSREMYRVKGEVYQINTQTGEFDLIPVGTNIETITRQLFDKDGNRLDFNDRRFFDVNSSQMEGINFALVGPMIVDYWERAAGRGRIIPTGAADVKKGTILPNKDFVPVRHSRVEHVDFVAPHDRPNLVIGREYTPVKTGRLQRVTNNFFEKIVGPVLDAMVRNPMSFAAYHTARLAGLRVMDDLLSPQLIAELDKTLSVVRARMSAEDGNFDDLVRQYAQNTSEESARALAVYQVYSQIASRDLWEFYRAGVLDFDQLKTHLKFRYFVDGPNGPSEVSWLDINGVDASLISRELDDLIDVLTPEIADAIGTVQKHSEHLDLMSVQKAINNVAPFIDSAEFRSVFSQKASNMLPFWYAEENFIKRWLRGARSGMYGIDQLVKAQYAVQGLLTTGIIYEENGTYYLNWPGSPLITGLLDTVFGSPQMGTVVRSPVETILPGLNPEAGRPTLGPLATIPISALTFVASEIAPSLKDEMSQFNRHIMGDIGSMQSWQNRLIPTTLRRLWDAGRSILAPDEFNETYMSSAVVAVVNLDGAGYGLDETATPLEQQVFWDRVRAHTRQIFLTKLLFGFVIPGSPQTADTMEDPFSLRSVTGIGLRNPAALVKGEYFRYIQTWGADEGTRRYLADFPDSNLNFIVNPEAYMVGRSQTVSGAPLAPNEENLQWTLENQQYIKSNPMATLWLAPNKSYEGEWNQYAWADQFASDLRIMKTPPEIQESIQFQKAAPAYFDAQEAYELRRAQAEGNSELINAIDADWGIQRDYYLKTHPVFAAMLQDSEGKLVRQKTINEFRVVLYDPDAPPSPFTEPVKELFELWDRYTVAQGQLRLDRTTASRETQEQNKEIMEDAVDRWLLKNPQLEALWLSVFKPETDL